MKVRMTFDLSDEDRRAIALAHRRKKAAGRTLAIQHLTQTITEDLAAGRGKLRRVEADPDPHQAKLPGMEPVYEP